MGVLASMERRGSLENPSTSLANPAAWLVDWMRGGGAPAAGVAVSEHRAMAHGTVMSCVRVLAEALAMLPLPVYRRLSRGRARATDHPLYALLHDRPNPELTSFGFREVLQGHLGLRGNAYAEIEYAKSGRPLALWPITPDRVTPFRERGLKRYRVQMPDGSPVTLEAEQMLHVPGFGYDGLVGLSPIGIMRHTIGLAIATEEYGSRFFGSGSRPGGVLTRPSSAPALSPEARARLKASWEDVQGGLTNAHRVALLEEGMEWKQIGIAPDDSQFLETRKFQRAEICGWYRVPPHMIADLERSTFSNIEQQSLEFLTYTMQPWLARWEQTLSWDLVSERERGDVYAEFNVTGLLRGDAAARAAYYAARFNIGSLSPNDIRELENENPVPGGDRYFVQGAYVPVEQAGQQPPAPAKPDAAIRALRPVVEDIARRVVSREANQAERNEKRTAEELEAFYRDDLGEFLTRALAPALTAAAALGLPARDAAPIAVTAARSLYTQRSAPDRAALLADTLIAALEAA